MTMQHKAIILAHYLPQYHPVPENDQWWGEGFTEWTNTTRAKPLFPGHFQPNMPSLLGYYDLRDPGTREQQAMLARQHGITGFAYWHYWFGNGRTILERPLNEVIASGKPDFPFCLSWANETWTGIWHGLKDKVLVEQTYPGEEDYTAHFRHVLPAFRDPRYIRIENRPLFIVYLPHLLPDPAGYTALWNRLARNEGFDGVFFVGIHNYYWDHQHDGFDEKSVHPLPYYISQFKKNPLRNLMNNLGNMRSRRIPNTFPYKGVTDQYDYRGFQRFDYLPSVLPNWDNTPRSGRLGTVLHGSTPGLFREHFERIMKAVISGPTNPHRIVLLKSWNEWAEGNYLEPDERWGTGYLEAVRDVLASLTINSSPG